MKEIDLPGKTLKLSKHGLSQPAQSWLITTSIILLSLFIIVGVYFSLGEPITESFVVWLSLFSLTLMVLFLLNIRTPEGYHRLYHHYLNVHNGTLTLKRPWKEPIRVPLEQYGGYRESGPQIYLQLGGNEVDIKRGYLSAYQKKEDVKAWLADNLPTDNTTT